jgi:hypothetical protein
MKFAGNYNWWINSELLYNMSKDDSSGVTKLHNPGRWSGHPSLAQYNEKIKVYEKYKDQTFQQFFSVSDPIKENAFSLPELPQTRNEIFWWIVKLKPGQYQTVHQDPHLYTSVNPVRYTLYLQDWEPGHIFIYNDKTISNYKAGDLYEWDDPLMEHAVVNTSHNVRYSLQISMQDKIEGEFLVPNNEAGY